MKNWIIAIALINLTFGAINVFIGMPYLALMNFVCSIPAFYFYLKLEVK